MSSLIIPKLPFEIKSSRSKFILTVVLISIPFLPWVAFTTGQGHVSALDPHERIQTISMPIDGLISNWNISEGAQVEQGQILATLQDNDPNILQRYKRELDAAEAALESSKLGLETSRINLKRQLTLFGKGLSSRKDYEKAKIDTTKLEMEYSKAVTLLTKAETQFSRQQQFIRAPRSGIISRIMPGERGNLIKAATPIAVLVPSVKSSAVEVWIDGNDTAFIKKGQKANIQFEGWPSLQIAGWPGVAINTFKAKVHIVDAASSYEGKFRVLLVPDEPWPEEPFLRPGAHARANIILVNSFVLKEIWRQLTGLPPIQSPLKDELSKLLNKKIITTDKGK
jgi:multidrug resistance efflux pump